MMTEATMPVPWLIEELLPHAAPMILIDSVLSCGTDMLEAQVRIAEDSAFCEGYRGVPAWVGVEYMAQSIAALAGVRAKRKGQPVRVGFLVGTRRYDTSVPLFPLGATLRITVSEIFEDGGMGVFDCEIRSEDDVALAAARLNVYLPPPQTLEQVEG